MFTHQSSPNEVSKNNHIMGRRPSGKHLLQQVPRGRQDNAIRKQGDYSIEEPLCSGSLCVGLPKDQDSSPKGVHLLRHPGGGIWVHSPLKVAVLSVVHTASHTFGLGGCDHGPRSSVGQFTLLQPV